MKKTFAMPLVLALLLAVPAGAAEQSKTLKERIRSVSNRMFVKSGRVELTLLPLTSISLNDAFYQKLGFGAQFAYHFSEAFAFQVLGTYTLPDLNLSTGNASAYTVSATGDSIIPYAGKRTYLFGADFCWSPIYGKISLAAEWVVHFDTYLSAGVGGIGGELKIQDNASSNFGFAGVFGVGARIFFDRTWALKVELKDYMIFNDKVTFKNVERADVQHQLMVNLGLSIFFLDGHEED